MVTYPANSVRRWTSEYGGTSTCRSSGVVPSRVVDVDVVAQLAQAGDQRLDVTAPVEHRPAGLDRHVVRGHQVLRRVHGDAARLQAVHLLHDEVRPGRQGAQVLQGTRRPGEVEGTRAQVAGNGLHVHLPEAHTAGELVCGAQPPLIEVLQPARPLRRRVRPAARHRRLAAAGQRRPRRSPRPRTAPSAAPGRPRSRGHAAPAASTPRSCSASATKSHSHILRWSMTSRRGREPSRRRPRRRRPTSAAGAPPRPATPASAATRPSTVASAAP